MKKYNTLNERIVTYLLGATRPCTLAMIGGFLSVSTTKRYPEDLHDFRDCIVLLDKFPEIRYKLDKIAELSPIWGRIIRDWTTIEYNISENSRLCSELLERAIYDLK